MGGGWWGGSLNSDEVVPVRETQQGRAGQGWEVLGLQMDKAMLGAQGDRCIVGSQQKSGRLHSIQAPRERVKHRGEEHGSGAY